MVRARNVLLMSGGDKEARQDALQAAAKARRKLKRLRYLAKPGKRERDRERAKKWAEANPEKVAENHRRWAAANRAYLREYHRRYHANRKSECVEARA